MADWIAERFLLEEAPNQPAAIEAGLPAHPPEDPLDAGRGQLYE